MQLPAVNDTIVAVSSAWQATPLGIVRLSGTESFALLGRLGVPAPARDRAQWTAACLRLDSVGVLPVTVFWFPAPRSYTGQDVVELHTVGCLPFLRELSARLIELGARRALPGEFTARAYLAGRLDRRQVEGVLALMQSGHEAAVRQAARLARASQTQLVTDVVERITQLLALIEAGIDFVEEEDIRFVTPQQVVRAIDELLERLAGRGGADADEPRAGKPHVALVGVRNAGKSILFNALVGYERAIVSPVLGTTRDVLSAEVELDGVSAVLQDCAGLGDSADELELATHLATERTAQQADLVLWVHVADSAWDQPEIETCLRIAPQRTVLVHSKMDLARCRSPCKVPVPFIEVSAVSAAEGTGMAELRAMLTRRLSKLAAPGSEARQSAEFRGAAAALARARAIAATSESELCSPELVALELRAVHDMLAEKTHGALDEEVLGRIFSQFCVGK